MFSKTEGRTASCYPQNISLDEKCGFHRFISDVIFWITLIGRKRNHTRVFYEFAPPRNHAVNGENKHKPVALEETDLLDSIQSHSTRGPV